MKTFLASCATAAVLALGAGQASAETISNPVNSYSLGNLCGSLVGGCQTQYFGEKLYGSDHGELTNFQFTLNSSTLQSLYAVVYTWNGTSPGTELWRSATVAGTAGLLSFNPTGVALTQGQNYVAFLSTYGLAGNSGSATLGDCLSFAGCGSNAIRYLGDAVWGNVMGANFDELAFTHVAYHDLTFSATISAGAVPEAATWAMMIGGFAFAGAAMRRRKVAVRFA